MFNATIMRKTDGYTKIMVPNESYDNITSLLKDFGLNVRENFYMKTHLSESRNIIGLPYSYNGGTTLRGQGLRIAILDTGVDTSHLDLPWGSKVVFWNDTLFPPWNSYHLANPADPDGHGTHVSSIAAGTGANSSGLYAGIAPDAELLEWRVCREYECDFAAASEAMDQAVSQGVDVISMSSGSNPQIWDYLFSQGQMPCSFSDACSGNCPSGVDVDDVYNSIINAINNNIPVVVSAGNEGSFPNTIEFPSCINNVISVGAAQKNVITKNDNIFMCL
jgi:subtilisin family serine protease